MEMRRRWLQTESGCSRGEEGTWCCCRPAWARRSRCPREIWCGLEMARGCPTRRGSCSLATVQTTRREATFRKSHPACLARSRRPEWCSPTNRRLETSNSVLGRVGATWVLFPIHGGDGRPVPVLTPEDIPLQWSHGGRYVYTVASVDEGTQAAIDVFRVELATGDRTLWKTLRPSDPVGVEDVRRSVVITPDAQSVLLFLYATARRPVRGRSAEVRCRFASDRSCSTWRAASCFATVNACRSLPRHSSC